MIKSLFSMLRPPPRGESAGSLAVADGDGSWAGEPASDDELVGKCLNGTYVVEKVLGSGGMGRVYSARHTRIGQKRFAIKVLKPEFFSNSEILARFRREAEAAACISHPNVVGVYDVDTTGEGLAYLVCEFLEGMDLAGLLQRSKLIDVQTAVHVAIQVCRALEAAHAQGVVHRDLKPHNVFLLAESSGAISPRPVIKVLDFGLSRFMDSQDTQLTRAGVIMGTPAYMSPEQASAKVADHRSDVYGVGAILYAALTGKPPFEAEHLQGVVLAVLTEEPPPPRQKNPAIPENLELVIQRAMAKNPEERYQNMSELRQALEPFAEADPFFQAAGAERRSPSNQRASRAMLEAEALAVSTARPRLLFYSLLAVLLLVAGLSSSVSTLELLTGKFRFTNTELALLLLAIVGTLLTPALLFIRRLRKSVWGNHARVLELLDALKSSLLLAVLSYGGAALALRVLDDVVARFDISPLFGRAPAWAGWNALFFAIALSFAVIGGLRRRVARDREGRLFARLLSPALAVLAPLVALVLLHLGLLWRSASAPGEVSAPRAEPSKPAPAVAAATAPRAPLPEPPPPVAPGEAVLEAPHDELARAIASGVEGLLPLAERYPRDPAVLKPLVLAFASRATGLADAMTICGRLFQTAPEEARDPDLRFLVKRGAGSPGEASKLAFELLTQRMGSTGPDLLYELALSGSKAQKRAEELLQTKGVRQQASPALLIAHELRLADSCAARVPLLERAGALGDERSVAVLAPLSSGSKRGCGKRKRSPCPAACAAEATRYTQAIARIQSRLTAARGP